MKSAFFTLLLLAFTPSLQAIDTYQPGDTLYVWASSGLTLRKEPSLKSAKLAIIPYGTAVITQNYPGMRVEVEAVPGFSMNDQEYPPVLLNGSFALVSFQGDTSYVFDGYLSKLPALKRTIDKQDNRPVFESFADWSKRNFKLVASHKRGTCEYGMPSSATQVYGNGFIVTSWTEKDAATRTILPDVSLEEAFLIFNYTENYEWEVRHPSDNPLDASWSFTMPSETEWVFGNGLCGYKILYLPQERIVVINSECSC